MRDKKKEKTPKLKSFKAVIEETTEVSNCFEEGLKGLGKYSNKVELADPKKCEGSVDIDACVAKYYPNESRWDYVFGYKGEAFFIEVHSADTSEVGVVLKKLQWLKNWLNSQAPELNKIKAKGQTFYWIQSKGNHILKNSK